MEERSVHEKMELSIKHKELGELLVRRRALEIQCRELFTQAQDVQNQIKLLDIEFERKASKLAPTSIYKPHTKKPSTPDPLKSLAAKIKTMSPEKVAEVINLLPLEVRKALGL